MARTLLSAKLLLQPQITQEITWGWTPWSVPSCRGATYFFPNRAPYFIRSSTCAPNRTTSRDEVRGYDADEFAGRDYLGLFPELWKMPLVAGYQVIYAGRVRAFQELVVVGIPCNLECTRGVNEQGMVLYELEQLLPKASSDFEFRAREDFPVFRDNGFADVQPGGSGHRKHEHGALESVRFQSRRDEDICVNDEAERDHCLINDPSVFARGWPCE